MNALHGVPLHPIVADIALEDLDGAPLNDLAVRRFEWAERIDRPFEGRALVEVIVVRRCHARATVFTVDAR